MFIFAHSFTHQIHPYAKMAWTTISSAHKVHHQGISMPHIFDVRVKVLLAQKNRDESISRLVSSMNDAYTFVHEADPLKKVESHKRIIILIVQQTTECGYLIRDYSKNKSFCKFLFS